MATALLFIGMVGVGVSVASLQLKDRAAQRVSRWAERRGLRVELGDFGLHIGSGLSATAIRVQGAKPSALTLTVGGITTDLGIMQLLSGVRVPDVVILSRPDLTLKVIDGAIPGFKRATGAPSGPSDSRGRRLPRRIEIKDGRAHLHLRQGPIALPTIELVALSGSLDRQDDGTHLLMLKGTLKWDGTPIAATFTGTYGGPDDALEIALERAVPIELNVAGRRLRVQAAGLEATRAGILRLKQVEGRSAGGAIRATSLELQREPVSALVLADLTFGLNAFEGSARTLTATLPKGDALPYIQITGLHGERPDLGLSADAKSLNLTLVDDFIAQIQGATPLAALAGVALSAPVLTVKVGGTGPLSALSKWTPDETGGPNPLDAAEPSTLLGENGASLRRRWIALLGDIAFSAEGGQVTLVDAEGSPLGVLSGAALSVERAPSGRASVTAAAVLKRDGSVLGQMNCTVSLAADGTIQRAKGRVAGTEFAHVVSNVSDYLTVAPDAHIDLNFNYAAPMEPQAPHALTGVVRVRRFGFQSWRISHTPIADLEGEAIFALTHQPKSHRTTLGLESIRIGEATLNASLDLERVPGSRLKFTARVGMPRQDCGAVASSIPPALIPRLSGLTAKGTMEFEAMLKVDMARPKKLRLEVDGDMRRCRLTHLGGDLDLAALRRDDFIHHPIEPDKGRRTDIAVGRGTDEWVPSHLLPFFLKAAARVTEDRNFFHHQGVRWDLIARALKLNLSKGRFVYGGSTITQQLVKNLFLTREKTLSRKLEELIIAWALEREFSKDEILTFYINMIEYGPNIYGVRHAARAYFGKEPRNLSPLEAAFIMGLKPYPKAGYHQWSTGSLNHWWVKRVSKVLEMMHKREGAITEIELLSAVPYQPRFRRPGETMYSGRRYTRPEAAPPAAEVPDGNSP